MVSSEDEGVVFSLCFEWGGRLYSGFVGRC